MIRDLRRHAGHCGHSGRHAVVHQLDGEDEHQTGQQSCPTGELLINNRLVFLERMCLESACLAVALNLQIKAVVFSGPGDQYFATCSDDGILHLWSEDNLEHLQFQVMGQVRFTCISTTPSPLPPSLPPSPLPSPALSPLPEQPGAPEVPGRGAGQVHLYLSCSLPPAPLSSSFPPPLPRAITTT